MHGRHHPSEEGLRSRTGDQAHITSEQAGGPEKAGN